MGKAEVIPFLSRDWICPVNFPTDVSDRLVILVSGKRQRRDLLVFPRQIFWFALIVELIFTMVLGTLLFVFLSPPGLIGLEIMRAVFFHTLVCEGLVVAAVLLAFLGGRRR
ncbi:MAG: hypothetical protein L6365_02990 [Desulfobulbaceae bacterium]|nr:hypothetical protein [Desulfobulbaceae bacterium]